MEGKVLYVAKCAAFFSLAAMLMSITFQVANISSRIDRWESNISSRLSDRDKQVASVLSSVSKLTKDGSDLVSDSYWDNKASTETTAVILRDVAEITRQIREDILPQTSGALSDTRVLMGSAKEVVASMDEDAKKLGPEVVAATKSLNTLLQTLEREIDEGSPKITETSEKLSTVLSSLDTLLQGEGTAVLSNTTKITNNVSEITHSVDMALRPLREKKSLLKRILSVVLNLVKVTIPAF